MTGERSSWGVQVRALRQAGGMSQQELATAAGLSMSLVAQIEQGKKQNPQLATVLVLAEALGVDLNALVAGVVPVRGKRRQRKRE